MRLIQAGICVCAIFMCTGCGQKASEAPSIRNRKPFDTPTTKDASEQWIKIAPVTQRSNAAVPDDWKRFAGDGFSVYVPKEVSVPDKPLTGYIKKSWFKSGTHWKFSEEAKAKIVVYSIQKFELEPSFLEYYRREPKLALASLATPGSGIVDSIKTEIDSTWVLVDGIEGVQTKPIEGNERGIRTFSIRRMVVKDSAVYNISVTETNGKSTESDVAVKAFFASIKFD